MKDNPLRELAALGQSIWLDYIRRDLSASDGLRRLIEEDGLRGMTSNPAIFERQVIPQFYNRDQNGLPAAWVARMRESMARLTPRFSADRTVREYTEQHYLPAAAAYGRRASDKGAMGRQMVQWRHTLDEQWSRFRFGRVNVETEDEQHMFEVRGEFRDLDPDAVRVEFYVDGTGGAAPLRLEMARVRQLAGASRGYVYSAAVPAARPPADYTARVIPHCDGAAIPLEDARILWQR